MLLLLLNQGRKMIYSAKKKSFIDRIEMAHIEYRKVELIASVIKSIRRVEELRLLKAQKTSA